MNKREIINLPKGGMIINTDIGTIQLGVPPETIKDTMGLDCGVPEYYIASKNLFSHTKMASLIDLEFPCNYNFFIKQKKTTVFCTRNQAVKIKDLISEAILGPAQLNLDMEYKSGIENTAFPDMRKEMDFFRQHPKENRKFDFDDIVNFVFLEENKAIKHNNINFFLDTTYNHIIITEDNYETILDWDIDFNPIDIEHTFSENIFIPPSFGITTLGSSHGFDPKGKTSGYIFWINSVGIMVDPPIDSALWLMEQNVDPKMVNSVILTHCHSDHDSGVMQKILQEGRITLYTTPTVFSSFIKKISILTELSEIDIIQLIDFVPVSINQAANINGAMFKFQYRLHSIPTVGFEISFKGRDVVCSSDHLNDPAFFRMLYDKKILTPGRYEELNNFEWEKDIIIHEAGIPPLHTPIDTLLKLPKNVKKRIFLVHTDKDKIPSDSGLRIAPTGLANTMVIDPTPTVHGESIQILNLISHLDIFQDIPFSKAGEFLSTIKYLKFKAGDCLIKEGNQNSRFFIIITGRAALLENNEEKALLTSGSYFGETSILMNNQAINSIIAITDLITITIEKNDFLMFISNSHIIEKLLKLGQNRNYGSWEVIMANTYFNTLTINQKNNLEILFDYIEAEEDEIILQENTPLEYAIFWNQGEAILLNSKSNINKEIKKGDYIGNPKYLLGEQNPEYTIISKNKSSYFKVQWDQMLKFFKQNPRILLELRQFDFFNNSDEENYE